MFNWDICALTNVNIRIGKNLCVASCISCWYALWKPTFLPQRWSSYLTPCWCRVRGHLISFPVATGSEILCCLLVWPLFVVVFTPYAWQNHLQSLSTYVLDLHIFAGMHLLLLQTLLQRWFLHWRSSYLIPCWCRIWDSLLINSLTFICHGFSCRMPGEATYHFYEPKSRNCHSSVWQTAEGRARTTQKKVRSAITKCKYHWNTWFWRLQGLILESPKLDFNDLLGFWGKVSSK